MWQEILLLIGGMLLMPAVYGLAIYLYRENFTLEKNRKRLPLRSFPELLVMVSAQAALCRIWWGTFITPEIGRLQFLLLTVMLMGMTVLCMTDYWEKLVPNRILLLLLLVWVVIMGLYGVRDPGGLLQLMAGVLLGVIFCGISFGFCFLLSRGSMGAGDVKLSIIMGMYLTGEYVVGAVLYGCILCAVYSLVMLFLKKLSRKDTIPFVPFLYAGMILRYFMG